MKVQVSIEFILLFTVSVAALAVFFNSYSSLINASDVVSSRAIFLRESSFFYELTKELCITGDGNIREVYFPYEFKVHYNHGKVSLSSDYGNMSYELPCKIENSLVKGKTRLINKDGKILIEEVK